MLPELAKSYEIVAPDLPGHGLTAAHPSGAMSLPGMARAVHELLKSIGVMPTLTIGHSAGAAVLSEMCLNGYIQPQALISINGAMLALPGLTGMLFASSARLLAAMPRVPGWVASLGQKRRFTAAMLDSTGSEISADMLQRYQWLTAQPSHIRAALQMMAAWDLVTLERRLPNLQQKVYLLHCENDKTVPPSEAVRLNALLSNSELTLLPGLGHLGHEEAPQHFTQFIAGLPESQLM